MTKGMDTPSAGKAESIQLKHGSLMCLSWNDNTTHEHSVPKTKALISMHISLTFQNVRETRPLPLIMVVAGQQNGQPEWKEGLCLKVVVEMASHGISNWTFTCS
jgi:hypothetical protein